MKDNIMFYQEVVVLLDDSYKEILANKFFNPCDLRKEYGGLIEIDNQYSKLMEYASVMEYFEKEYKKSLK